jgi:hypothetical protein
MPTTTGSANIVMTWAHLEIHSISRPRFGQASRQIGRLACANMIARGDRRCPPLGKSGREAAELAGLMRPV